MSFDCRTIAALILLPLVVSGCSFERMLNRVDPGPDRPAGAAAVEVHRKAFVVDLHADSLLWSRNLLQRADYAHVDVPRMIEGGINLQIFSMPTKTPWGLNFKSNKGNSDMLSLATPLKFWPVRTWNSPFERARYMA
jgi:membrane dipeptidase